MWIYCIYERIAKELSEINSHKNRDETKINYYLLKRSKWIDTVISQYDDAGDDDDDDEKEFFSFHYFAFLYSFYQNLVFVL